MKKCILLVLAVILLLSAILPGYMALVNDAKVLTSYPAMIMMDAVSTVKRSMAVAEFYGKFELINISYREYKLRFDGSAERYELDFNYGYALPGYELATSKIMTDTYYVPPYFHAVMGIVCIVLLAGSGTLTYLALKKRKVQPVHTDTE